MLEIAETYERIAASYDLIANFEQPLDVIPAIAAKKNNDTPNANIKPSATATECGKPSRMGLLPMGCPQKKLTDSGGAAI